MGSNRCTMGGSGRGRHVRNWTASRELGYGKAEKRNVTILAMIEHCRASVSSFIAVISGYMGEVDEEMDVEDEHKGNVTMKTHALEDMLPRTTTCLQICPPTHLCNALACAVTADLQVVAICSFQPQPLPHHPSHIPF